MSTDGFFPKFTFLLHELAAMQTCLLLFAFCFFPKGMAFANLQQARKSVSGFFRLFFEKEKGRT